MRGAGLRYRSRGARALGRGARIGVLALAFGLVPAAVAGADTITFGSSLSATPSLDTANGDHSTNGVKPSPFPQRTVATGAYASPSSPGYNHYAEDAVFFNSALASGTPTAVNGQILSMQLKGCAIDEPGAPTTGSPPQETSGGIPVNYFVLQALAPDSNSGYSSAAAGNAVKGTTPFLVPFCSSSSDPTTGAVNTSTVTTYQPLHECLGNGYLVGLHDIGGEIPQTAPGTGPWYASGIPLDVVAPIRGSTMDSYVGFPTTDAPWSGHYDPGAPSYDPAGAPGNRQDPTFSGWGTNAGEELTMQITEGTGDDAYGLCPGGNAVEPSDSNTVVCVTHKTNPGDKYGTCNASNQPVYAPTNSAPPTIAGAAQQGYTLTLTRGTWTNSPQISDKWVRCDGSGGNCNAIAGATGATYTLTAADVGATIEVQEIAANTANSEGPVSSAPTAVIAAAGATGITGTTGPTSVKLIVGKLRLTKYAFKARKGTTINYQDNLAGSTTLTVTKKGATKVLWTSTHQDQPGLNTVPFKVTRLRKGFYTLRIVTSYAGKSPITNSLTMRIVT